VLWDDEHAVASARPHETVRINCMFFMESPPLPIRMP
jgi:hypothetical protein